MRLRHDMNLSFKTQGVKESLTMALSYLCCALLLSSSARHWYWAKARIPWRRLIYYPRARVLLTIAGHLITEVWSLSFGSVLASLWSLVFFLVACVRMMLGVPIGRFVSDAGVMFLCRLWEELLLGLLHKLLAVEVQGLWLRIHESLRLYHVSYGLTQILIRHPAYIFVSSCRWVRQAHLVLWSQKGSHLNYFLV